MAAAGSCDRAMTKALFVWHLRAFQLATTSHLFPKTMGRLAPRQVYGITLTSDFLKKEPSYWKRDPEDPQEEEEDYLNTLYWGTAANFVTDRVCSICTCRLEYVETKFGTRPCVVLADTKDRAAVFKEDGSELLKIVQDAIGVDRIPHWYWL
ncbi:hypothetical protein BDP27DRAFT_75259 [Rhodocollybia butyracea]|uniref:Uncharacterized protein n=1 Tax=Rhodocollybia butyracea TaxID=206335 RepID=A0A9P5PKP0_9AGAR|nr:hypothetical protein BDP27DRAFT_75259 [Rhodocollybia butyracea]